MGIDRRSAQGVWVLLLAVATARSGEGPQGVVYPNVGSEVDSEVEPKRVDVPMRDGVKLETTIWIPGGDSYPTVRHGKWRLEDEWPLEGTKSTKFYLSSPDGSRVGSLTNRVPAVEPPTSYRYDPRDPVLTLGANGSHDHVPGLIAVGPIDQRPNEKRQDVLVYTTSPLREDTEIVGPLEARIFAASSARTPIIAK